MTTKMFGGRHSSSLPAVADAFEFILASSGWTIGLCIGLPCVVMFGSRVLKEKVVKPCMRGDKVICLAVTEPGTGSDVAQLTCSAKKTPCGKFYIVNGEKKWITNGIYADFFTTAVRTGGPGANGVTMLVIERGPGVTTRKMDCTGMWASGTTYVVFEDVKVPVENVVGAENQGFMVLMYNFTRERISACVQINRLARVCLEESIKYSLERKTFGKKTL